MKARVGPSFTAHLVFASSAFRHVVDLLVAMIAGQDYRDFMNAGKVLSRLAKFEKRVSDR